MEYVHKTRRREKDEVFGYCKKTIGYYTFGIYPTPVIQYYCVMIYIICKNSYHIRKWCHQLMFDNNNKIIVQGLLILQKNVYCKIFYNIVVFIIIINLATMFTCYHCRDIIESPWFLI